MHDDVIDRLPELAGRPLPGDVAAHLRSCDACLAQHDAWAAMREAVGFVDVEAQRRRPARALAAFAAAAAAAVTLALANADNDRSAIVTADARKQPLERPRIAADASECDLSDVPAPAVGPHPTVTWEVSGDIQNERGISDRSTTAVAKLVGDRVDHIEHDGDRYFRVETGDAPTGPQRWILIAGEPAPLDGWHYLQLSPDPTAYLATAAANGVDFRCVGREAVNGVAAARYVSPGSPLDAREIGLWADSMKEVWIDSSGRPRRLRGTFTHLETDEPDARRQITVSTHDIIDYGHADPVPVPAGEMIDVRDEREARRLATGS